MPQCPQEAIPEETRHKVTGLMLRAFEAAAGLPAASLSPVHTHVQLWGAAVPLNTVAGSEPCALDVDSAVGVCGDWFTAPSIEVRAGPSRVLMCTRR